MVLSKACIAVAIINATAACRRPEIESRVASRVIRSRDGSAPRKAILDHPTKSEPLSCVSFARSSATLGARGQKTIIVSSEEHPFVNVFFNDFLSKASKILQIFDLDRYKTNPTL
jgi:hypothetical protein